MTTDELRRYSEMIVRSCIAFRRGDALLVRAGLAHRELAAALTGAAYRAGALGVEVEYADDLVVLCPTKSRAEQAQQLVGTVLTKLGLRLHPDKTRIASLAKGEEGFDFLGFHHRKVESWKWRGRYYLQS